MADTAAQAAKHQPLAPQKLQDPNIPDPEGACFFFKLPPELRLDIYEFALCDFTLDTSKAGKGQSQAPSLMRINKIIRNEATDAYLTRLNVYDKTASEGFHTKVQEYQESLKVLQAKSAAGGFPMADFRKEMTIWISDVSSTEVSFVAFVRMVQAEMEGVDRERKEGIHSGKLTSKPFTIDDDCEGSSAGTAGDE